jgi:hypothetical protein
MLDGLDGELIVLDSKPMLGIARQGTMAVVEPPRTALVAFGAFTVCDRWETIAIPDSVITFGDLQTFIASALKDRNRDWNQLNPVRLQCHVDWLHWFIVRGMGNLKPNPRESFLRQLLKGGLNSVQIDATGVFSEGHLGIVTNKTSSLHLHFSVISSKQPASFVAHLDDNIQLLPGGKLFLPAGA